MALLTHDDYAAITARVSGYPERVVVAPVYPAPRRRRPLREGEEETLTAGQLPAATNLTGRPRVRIIDFLPIDTPISNSDLMSVSHRILGPALIDWVYWQQDIANAANTKLSIFVTEDGSLIQGPQTSPYPIQGTPIFEWNNHDNIGLSYTTPNSIGTFNSGSAVAPTGTIYIKYPVFKSEFYIKVRFSFATGTINNAPPSHLLMRIIENIDPMPLV